MAINISTLTSQQIEDLHTPIVAIYREAFASPPYRKPAAEIAHFAQSLPTQLSREDFRFVGAFDGDPHRLIGFAYGYATAAGRWWLRAVEPALSLPMATHWLRDSFQFVEIAVDPAAQGQGIGGRLHDQLLCGIRQRRALLSTLQADTAAHHLYRARGWVVLLQDFFFPGVVRRYQIMGLELEALVGSAPVV